MFDKIDGNLLKIEKVNYSTLYDVYYGYIVNVFNGLNVNEIDENYMDSIDSMYDFRSYDFLMGKGGATLNLNIGSKDLSFKFYNNDKIFMISYDVNNDKVLGYKYVECKILNDNVDYSLCDQVGFVNKRSYLYRDVGSNETKMYLVKGDQVIIKNVKTSQNEKWYFINYKGKKDINMWIKADAVDLN